VQSVLDYLRTDSDWEKVQEAAKAVHDLFNERDLTLAQGMSVLTLLLGQAIEHCLEKEGVPSPSQTSLALAMLPTQLMHTFVSACKPEGGKVE